MPIWLAIKTCLKDKLFVTGGRAGRAEFWWFTLFTILVRVAMYPLNLAGYAGIIFAAVSFLLFIGNYTVLTRRLHDTDRSIIHAFPLIVGLLLGLAGFFMNVRLAVTVGEVIAAAAFVYLLVLCALPGTKGTNRYGEPMPLGAAPVEDVSWALCSMDLRKPLSPWLLPKSLVTAAGQPEVLSADSQATYR